MKIFYNLVFNSGKEENNIMCYYIGIEDLAANALIEILRKKENKENSQCIVTLKELEKYGAEVVRYLDGQGEKALLILSRASTNHMFRNYCDFFEEIESEEGTAIALQKGKTVEDLIEKFRTYIAVDLVRAFMSEETVCALYA